MKYTNFFFTYSNYMIYSSKTVIQIYNKHVLLILTLNTFKDCITFRRKQMTVFLYAKFSKKKISAYSCVLEHSILFTPSPLWGHKPLKADIF